MEQMLKLGKYFGCEWVEIYVKEKDYNDAYDEALRELNITSEEEERKRYFDIDDYINNCFISQFQDELQKAESQDDYESDYYKLLNMYLNRQQF